MRRRRLIHVIALIATACVVVLLAAAAAGIGMADAHRLATPRVTTLTVGGCLMPIPAAAWIAFLWCGDRPRSAGALVRRILGTAALTAIGYLGFGWGVVLASFAG